MMKNEVSVYDAISIIHLMEVTLWSGLIDQITTISYESDAEYYFIRDQILNSLNFNKHDHKSIYQKSMFSPIDQTPNEI